MLKVKIASLILSIIVLTGCTSLYFLSYKPSEITSSRRHYLGMTVYNMTGEELKDQEWDLKFYAVTEGYLSLQNCIGTELDRGAYQKLKDISIVILPTKEYRGGKIAMALFPYIYVYFNHLNAMVVRHEFVHLYLYLSKGKIFGDPLHSDLIFERCEHELPLFDKL